MWQARGTVVLLLRAQGAHLENHHPQQQEQTAQQETQVHEDAAEGCGEEMNWDLKDRDGAFQQEIANKELGKWGRKRKTTGEGHGKSPGVEGGRHESRQSRFEGTRESRLGTQAPW